MSDFGMEARTVAEQGDGADAVHVVYSFRCRTSADRRAGTARRVRLDGPRGSARRWIHTRDDDARSGGCHERSQDQEEAQRATES